MDVGAGLGELVSFRRVFDEQADLLVSALDRTSPQAATRCAGWTVADLDRHLGQITGSLAGGLAPGDQDAADATVADWARALPGLATLIDTAARGEGPRLRAALPALRRELDRTSATATVSQRTGRHAAADALLFRIVELVVHGMDLPDPVGPAPQALGLVVRTFAGLLADRAPGRDVAVAVPGVVSVACAEASPGDGPAAVDIDAVAFVGLCAGRVAWSDALDRGLVRVRAGRTDLSPYLPLIA